MKGKWNGTYWYEGNATDSIKYRITPFQLIIEHVKGKKISGNVKDDTKMGGTKGVGTINGSIKGNKIKFVKRMPIHTVILHNGTRIEENKPHRPIYYKGIINKEGDHIEGTWRFKMGLGFVDGKIALFLGTRGFWEMKKATEI